MSIEVDAQKKEWKDMNVGRHLQDARLNAKITQTQLAEKLNQYNKDNNAGFSKDFAKNDIEQWENNRKEIKQVEIIVAMAKILNTDCHTLLTGADRKDQNIVDEFNLSPVTLTALRLGHVRSEAINFFLENPIYHRLFMRIYEFIEAPNEHKKLEGEEVYVNVADIHLVNVETELRRLRRGNLGDKRFRESFAAEGVKDNAAQTRKRGRNSKAEKA